MLRANFFDRDSHEVARELLGKLMIRRYESGREKIGRIVEVEVYQGLNDLASHASGKRTQRNEIMFGEAGHYYVYMVYGMHYCLNIVTEGREYPAAILIRALEPISDTEYALESERKDRLANGPGKLCRWLDIDKEFNGKSVESGLLFIEEDDKFVLNEIAQAKRIGVDYAGESANLKWRYYLRDNKFISKR